jgi:CheY-like chemotaxis protein
MTEPLALVLYEKLLPGTQLVNKLQDLGYRIQTVSDASMLCDAAEKNGPLLMFVDLESSNADLLDVISRLRRSPATEHLPVIAFGREDQPELHEKARKAGVTIIASHVVLANHLPELLEQALQV